MVNLAARMAGILLLRRADLRRAEQEAILTSHRSSELAISIDSEQLSTKQEEDHKATLVRP